MTDWNNLSITLNYVDVLSDVKNRDIDSATLFANGASNPPVNAIRFNRSGRIFETWDGGAWQYLGQKHDASELVQGTLPDGRLSSRLAPNAKQITDWNQAVESGFYVGYNAGNSPVPNSCSGVVTALSNGYVKQVVHVFSTTSETYERVLYNNGSVWSDWVLTYGENFLTPAHITTNYLTWYFYGHLNVKTRINLEGELSFVDPKPFFIGKYDFSGYMPTFAFDAGDYLFYDRTNNLYNFYIEGAPALSIANDTLGAKFISCGSIRSDRVAAGGGSWAAHEWRGLYNDMCTFICGGDPGQNTLLLQAANRDTGAYLRTIAFFNLGNGNFYSYGNVYAYSDERLKKNWRPLPDDFVIRLAEVKHGIYDRTDSNEIQVGVSAQSFQKILPEAVSADKDGMLTIAYANAALSSVIKIAEYAVELESRIARLEKLLGVYNDSSI